MSRILHTYDYELFFGAHSGTPENCLLKPTQILLRLAKETSAYGVLFVDGMYLWRLSEQPTSVHQDSLKKIENQLLEALNQGWDLGFHIHPHWIDAVWQASKGNWVFPHYRNFTLQGPSLISHSNPFLDALDWIREHDLAIYRKARRPTPTQRLYRAGGWCIEPWATSRPVLDRLGASVDSSIVPGLRFPDQTQPFDHRKWPPGETGPWNFEHDLCAQNPLGKYTELPVATFPLSRLHGSLSAKTIFGDGSSILGTQVSFFNKLRKRAFEPRVGLLTLETSKGIRAGNLWLETSTKKPSILVSVTHPKGLENSSSWYKVAKDLWPGAFSTFKDRSEFETTLRQGASR